MWRAVACSKQKQQQQQNNTAFCTQILVVGLLVNQLDCFIVCTASYPLWLLPLYKLHSPLWSGSWNSIHSAKAILPRSLTRCIRYIWGVFHDFRDVWNLCGKTMVKGAEMALPACPCLGAVLGSFGAALQKGLGLIHRGGLTCAQCVMLTDCFSGYAARKRRQMPGKCAAAKQFHLSI